jgi:hypothetical protein
MRVTSGMSISSLPFLVYQPSGNGRGRSKCIVLRL